jgi:6-phosphogluconolactonase
MSNADDHSSASKRVPHGITRRQFLPLLGLSTAAVIAPGVLAAGPDHSKRRSNADARFVYVGTYTAPDVPPGGTHPSSAIGISVFKMDPANGDLTLLQVVPASNPSFLALDPASTHLYSVNENLAGGVSAYALNPADGTLSFLNAVSANGKHTTHLSVHPGGHYLLAANYTSGNFTAFRIEADGTIGAMTADFQSTGNGSGPNPDRQEGPHAHQILTDLDAIHVFGVDLGADKVDVMDLDSGTLTPAIVPFAPVASGSGPRHMAFHPDRQRAYVLDELVSSITVFDFDPSRGALVWKQTISTLPRSFSGFNTTAEIRIHPSGRFLYNTNRGHNSVTMYDIDEETGELGVIGWEPTQGEWPRGMNIDPSGTFLYAANQNTDSIAVFRIQPSNGKLRPSAFVRTPTPVDVEFGPLA